MSDEQEPSGWAFEWMSRGGWVEGISRTHPGSLGTCNVEPLFRKSPAASRPDEQGEPVASVLADQLEAAWYTSTPTRGIGWIARDNLSTILSALRAHPAPAASRPAEQGEPVAWAYEYLERGQWKAAVIEHDPKPYLDPEHSRNVRPLYAHPAPAASRPAVGREEIARALYEHDTPEPRFLWPIQNERMAAIYRSRADAVLALLDPRDDTRAGGADAQEGGWLPIETAPKDGQIIAVAGGCAYWDVERECWCSAVGMVHGRPIQWKITHWKTVNPITLPSPAPETRDDKRDGG